MKVFYRHTGLWMLSLLLFSCVADDGLFPEPAEDQTTASIALVTFFEALEGIQDRTGSELCFGFEFPITMTYSNGSKIEVQDFEGILAVSQNQTSVLHAKAIQFPFRINVDERDFDPTITDEEDFIALLSQCQIPTFRTTWDTFLGSCFEVQYPIAMVTNDDRAISLANNNEYTRFMLSQGSEYQPRFVFPIIFLNPSSESSITINSYFDLYRLWDTCEISCPTLNFSRDGDFLYADVVEPDAASTVSEAIRYGWYMDGELVTEEIDKVTQGELPLADLDPGTYTICIATLNDSCSDTTLLCQEIEIADLPDCPELQFVAERSTGGATFFADFEGIDTTIYSWSVNGDLVENDGGATGDNEFFFQFGLGTYEICIASETPDCPLGISFCKTLVFDDSCPDLSFGIETLSEGNYKGIADFELRTQITYAWYIDGQLQERDGGPMGDNFVGLELPTGTYEICIQEEVSGCQEPNVFCKSLVVP